ncbi:hypothetical protein ABT368_32320 [Streptomyces althioticus]|uniref:hypothetical protein n=1 Tax=Streptomyces althioticus TaxID=83380 RepID=UPI001876CEE5|nr:hypothetical protein GCM10010243_46990 [Streptomyces matensis]
MTTAKERAAALKAKLAKAHPDAPRDSAELASLSTQAMLRDAGYPITEEPPQLDVRLHGRAVPGHEVPVREATSILGTVQEAVSACGQAVAKKATAAGAIHSAILRATELRFSPALGFGSVVFHLGGTAEPVTGDEIPETTGSDTLLDLVFRTLFKVINTAQVDDPAKASPVDDLRLLGPRTAKHLNDLAKAITESEIDVDFVWRSRVERSRATLGRRGALALKDAIERTKEEITVQNIRGTLSTVSTVVHPQLLTDDGRRINLSVDPEGAAHLGAYFNRRVEVQVEQKRSWSVTTGRESFNHKLLRIEYIDGRADAADQQVIANPTDSERA